MGGCSVPFSLFLPTPYSSLVRCFFGHRDIASLSYCHAEGPCTNQSILSHDMFYMAWWLQVLDKLGEAPYALLSKTQRVALGTILFK